MKLSIEACQKILDTLEIECGVIIIADKHTRPEVMFNPYEEEAVIYASDLAAFVEAAGRLRLGLVYDHLLATPVFCEAGDYEDMKLKVKLMELWRPLLAGWAWKGVRELLEPELVLRLRRDIRLKLDEAIFRRMMGERTPEIQDLFSLQVVSYVLGERFSIPVNGEKYREYTQITMGLLEEEPDVFLLERVAKPFYPDLRIKVCEEEDQLRCIVPAELEEVET